MERSCLFRINHLNVVRLVPLKTQPMFDFPMLYLQCGAPKISKLVYNSNNYGFMVLITIVTGAYKPTYNWGASHCTKSYGKWVTVWWLSPTPLKNDGVKVSWDDDIPNIWKNMFQTTNQLIYSWFTCLPI